MKLSRIVVVTLAHVVPELALAQAVLRPNQIAGTVTFTNTNPEIREVIEQASTHRIRATAESRSVPVLRASTWSGSPTREGSYELTVESSEDGIPYGVSVSSGTLFGPADEHWYDFAPQQAGPVQVEPAPDVELHFAECAGLVRARFARPGIPSDVTGGTIRAIALDAPGGAGGLVSSTRVPRDAVVADLLVRAGLSYRIEVTWETGSDPTHDTLRLERAFEVYAECDVISPELDCTLNPHVFELGRIVGRFDVIGEREVPVVLDGVPGLTSVSAHAGPWNNSRRDYLTSDPASGLFELENLVPSNVTEPETPYDLSVRYLLGEGPGLNACTNSELEVLVPEGTTHDLGDALVMVPAHLGGDVLLAGPPASSGGSIFEELRHLEEIDSVVAPWGWRTSVTASSDGADATAGLVGEVDPELGEYRAQHELILAHSGDDARSWDAGGLQLHFQRLGSRSPYCSVGVRDPSFEDVVLSPGERREIERAYCLGTVRLRVETTDGLLSAPRAAMDLVRADELDHWGRPARYDAGGTASGTPASTFGPVGTVIAHLPAGRYRFDVTVTSRTLDGAQSTTGLLPVEVSVGCRQEVDATPELAAALSGFPSCAGAGFVSVRVTVTSSSPVAEVIARVNDLPPVELCRDCGLSPDVEGVVQLEDGENVLVVSVVDALGREASASASSLFAREPSVPFDPARPFEPLRVARADPADPNDLSVTWERVDGEGSSLHRGTLRSLWRARAYDHAPAAPCGLEESRLVLAQPTEDSYFLVSATCPWGETSTGRDSFGRERTDPVGPCP